MRQMPRSSAKYLKSVALGALLVPLQAAAQETAAGQTAGDADMSGLQDIVVTAQKVEQNLQNVPISIAVVDRAALETAGVESIFDLGQTVPNLTIGTETFYGTSSPGITIRGIGETTQSVTVDRPVGIYIDDIYIARPQASFLRQLDVAQVEVLRGPQGTLFGRNSAGGAIRVTTQKPKFDDASLELQADYGSYDRIDLSAIGNVPLTDSLAARVAYAYNSRDGYVKNLFTGERLGSNNTHLVRGQLRWNPDNRLNANLSVSYSNDRSNGSATDLLGVAAYNPANPTSSNIGGPTGVIGGFQQDPDGASAFCASYAGPQGDVPACITPPAGVFPNGVTQVLRADAFVTDDPYTTLKNREFTKNENLDVALAIDYDLNDFWSVKFLGGYSTFKQNALFDIDGTPAPINDRFYKVDAESWSSELQLNASLWDDRLKLVSGVYYFTEDPTEDQLDVRFDCNPGNNGLTNPATDADNNRCVGPASRRALDDQGPHSIRSVGAASTKSFGLYSQAIVKVTDRLTATIGGRYTKDKKRIVIQSFDKFETDPLQVGAPIGDAKSFDNFDYRLAVDYQWTDRFMTYASYSTGFRSGGFNTRKTDLTTNDIADKLFGLSPGEETFLPYDEEKVKMYEVGFRSQLFDNRLRFNGTYFNGDYSNKLLALPPPALGLTGGMAVINAIETLKTSGFEFETQFALTDNLILRGSLGTNKTDVKGLTPNFQTVIDTVLNDGIVTPLSSVPSVGPQSMVPQAPKLAWTAGATHNYRFGSGAKLTSNLSVTYKAKTITTFQNLANVGLGTEANGSRDGSAIVVPSYTLVNLRTSFTSADDRWTIALFCTNCLDNRYILGGYNFDPDIGSGTGGAEAFPTPIRNFTHEVVRSRPREFGVSVGLRF